MARTILTVFGTRPEAIKLFPLVHALDGDDRFVSRVCVTGQHRGMLVGVMSGVLWPPSKNWPAPPKVAGLNCRFLPR